MDLKSYIEDKKLQIGVVLIILNFAIGFVSKLPFLELIANPDAFSDHPLYFVSAIIAYLFSWTIGILGIYLIGKETWKMLQKRMREQVKTQYDEHIGQHVEKHVRPKVDRIVKQVKVGKEKIRQGLARNSKKKN